MTLSIPAQYYQQFDADFSLDVPGEGYGGWKTTELEIALDRTAVVVMHAWDCGTREEFPGWHRAVEYIPLADAVLRDVFPPLLEAVRRSPLPIFHVAAEAQKHKQLPGYLKTLEISGEPPGVLPAIEADDSLRALRQFRHDHVFPGAHNAADIARGVPRDFAPQARPQEDELIAETSEQLFAICQHTGVNHLIYAGFAIDGCLLMSPGGMMDMSRYGVMCSALREAVVAIENKETARTQLAKEIGLWRVELMFGFVFQTDEFINALAAAG
jgi:hypothetical protein